MANTSAPKSSTSKVISLIFIVIALIGAWYIAPMFMPVWRWQNIDFKLLAQKAPAESGITEASLAREFDVLVRYHPRQGNDPRPWQLIRMSPEWGSLSEDHDDETDYLLRVTFVSDYTGRPPSQFFVGNSYDKRYFTAKAWRLPPGILPLDHVRPVILYRADSLEYLPIGEASGLNLEINGASKWEHDDDGYTGAEQ